MTTPSLAPGLSRKVARIADLRTETPELLSALGTLSSFYASNSPDERKRLRGLIEKRAVSLNAEYLAAAESVIQALDGIQHGLNGLHDGCCRSREAVLGAQESTASLLTETERLQQELGANEKRADLVHRFFEKYQLSAGEVDALQAPDIGKEFFSALDRVRSIHTNCKSLLRTQHQRAGLELMDAMSAHQEAAFERLCRWVQSECRKLGDSDAHEVSPLLQQATAALRDRPVLFKYCTMEVATTRHNALFQRFIAALTQGGPNGMPRPIEMYAHDPRRYLGDMLAWVHQSLASERELITALFGDDGRPGGGVVGAADALAGIDMPRTTALLDRVFESICRPLKVRIEQVLLAAPPPLLCFSLSQLLAFYTALVDRLLGSGASLTRTLAGCRQLAGRLFQEQLKKAGDRLVKSPPAPPQDLTPPPQLTEAFQRLADIIASFEASFDADDGGGGESEMAPVLAAAADPLVTAIQLSTDMLSPKARAGDAQAAPTPAQRIYLVNCTAALEQVVAGHPSCRGRAREIGEQLASSVRDLVRSHALELLSRSGMAEIVDRMRLYRDGKSTMHSMMAADTALELSRVLQALKSFLSLLSQPEAQPEFRELQVPRIRTQAVSGVAVLLADAYQLVYDCLSDPKEGYSADARVSAALRHGPDEIRTILGSI